MGRRNFYDILNSSQKNIRADYVRLYKWYYEGTDFYTAIDDVVENLFDSLPSHLKGRTISLSDFNYTYDFSFEESPLILGNGTITDYLITFCEYTLNFCIALYEYVYDELDDYDISSIHHYCNLLRATMEDLGMVDIRKEKLIIIVPADPSVIAVAELVSDNLAVSILEYHHHNLKGDLDKKKAILKLMADNIERERSMLKSINKTLESQLFQLMNKFVRHDHSQTPHIATMTPQEIEECYDDIYQMWLLAKLEMDHQAERKDKVAQLLMQINS